jgi:hypothetical protein
MMKKISGFCICFSIIFFLASCSTGRKLAGPETLVVPLSDTVKAAERTTIYGLPMTVFNIVVEMERSVEIPGPYARYAGDLLGLGNVIQNETEEWSVKSITVESQQELDPGEFYVIKTNKMFSSNVLALKKVGLIMDLGSGSNRVEKRENIEDQGERRYRPVDLGSDEYFQVQRDTAFRRVSIDSSFIRIPYLVEKRRRLSADQLAEKAAKRLMEIRDGKHLILTGEANVFPQSEAAINEINRLEKEYTELFTGKILKETRSYSYRLIPDRAMGNKPFVLFQYSELTGPLAGTGKEGIPVNVLFTPEMKTNRLKIINSPKPATGGTVYDKLFYRMPDMVNMKISIGTEELFNSRKLIYQFGEVIQLPSNFVIGN